MKYNFQSEESKKNIIYPEIFQNYSDLRAGLSTKLAGGCDSRFAMNLSYNVGDDPSIVKNNRRIFLSQLKISEDQLAIPLQCHSKNILNIDAPGEYNACDGLITNIKNLALAVTVADCVPILLFDPVNKVIGAIHAGWKGTRLEIAKKAVKIMIDEHDSNPSQIIAFIGPSAGVCCYEVNDEVAVMFKNKIVPYNKGKVHVDLKEENKSQLQQAGVSSKKIEISAFCTICESKLFHSFRRDGENSGRMMAVICITD